MGFFSHIEYSGQLPDGKTAENLVTDDLEYGELWSGFLWVAIITTFGYVLNQIPFVKAHEKTVMTALLLIPVFFMIVGIGASLYLLIRHYRRHRALLNRRRYRVHKK
ncbi:hypothetical protein [Morganella morganii]|uniref:hypothetical protein n=1 Tax=Morganella morganii TaxID=582 RepID=UPI001FFCB0AF|nr:hypothetical protein [Morganella morganii]